MSTPLINLAYVYPFVGVTNDSSKDAILTVLIDGASDVINGYLNRNLLSQSYSEFYDFSQPDRTLVLRQFPVTALSQITLYDEGVATVVDGSNFIWEANGLVQFSPSSTFGWWFPQGFQSVQANYTAGYSSVPNDIQLACAMVIQRTFFNIARNPLIASERLGDYSATYKSAIEIELLSPDVRAILSKYRSSAV